MFKQYRKKQIAEMRPYVVGESMNYISVSEEDRKTGSPKQGDFIARNPKNHNDLWLVSGEFVKQNYEKVD